MNSSFPQHIKSFPQRFSTLASVKAAVLSLAALAIAFLGAQTAWAQPETTTTTLALTSNGAAVTSVAAGTVVTLTAKVTALGAPLTPGTVNFCDATVSYCTDIRLIGTAQLTSKGTASIKFRPAAGNHSYKAVFQGTSSRTSYAVSASSSASLTVTGKSPTAITLGTNDGSQLTATVTTSGPLAALPSGTIQFLDTSDGNALLGSAALSAARAGFAFVGSQILEETANPDSIVAGDFNGDGIVDLVVPNTNGDVFLYPGKGDGTFGAPVTVATGVTQTLSPVTGDFNGDGFLDIALAGNGITVLLGDGKGNFKAQAQAGSTVQSSSSPGQFATADFNADGILDLVVANGNTVTVLFGNGDGTFTSEPKPTTITANVQAFAVGDFNGDGKMDLAVVSQSDDSSITVLLGNGDGTFSSTNVPLDRRPDWEPQTITTLTYIVAGDFNGDGKLDLAICSFTTPVVPGDGNTGGANVQLGKGDGTFSPQSGVLRNSGPEFMAIGDFNGDGNLDVVVSTITNTGFGGATETLLYGDGAGKLPVSAVFQTPGLDSSLVAVGDFKGNGISDFGISNYDIEYDRVGLLTTGMMGGTESATAEVTGLSFAAGTGIHPVVASYPGNTFGGADISPPFNLYAPVGKSTVSLTASTNPATYGTPQALRAIVTGNGAIPAGSVSFYDGTTLLGTGTLSGGVAPCPPSALAPGVHSMTAQFAGEPNYYPPSQTAAPLSLTVNKATPTVSLTSSTASGASGTIVTFKAAVTGAAAGVPPTGSVNFYSGKTLLRTETLNAAGVAAYPTNTLPPGKDSITASYVGDSNYLPAVSSALILEVTGTATVTLGYSPSSVTYGELVRLTAMVTGNGVEPTGVVTLLFGTKKLGSGSLSSRGVFSDVTVSLPTGVDSITASYAGDSNYTSTSSTPVAVTVNKATPKVTLASSASTIAAGKPVTLTATLSRTGTSPSGTVTFYSGTKALGTATLKSGVAKLTVTTLADGKDSITASYPGDVNYLPATSAAVTVTVN
jgi:hypothetical protein